MSQGELTQTGKDFDVAIRGEGFFRRFCCPMAVPPIGATDHLSWTRKAGW